MQALLKRTEHQLRFTTACIVDKEEHKHETTTTTTTTKSERSLLSLHISHVIAIFVLHDMGKTAKCFKLWWKHLAELSWPSEAEAPHVIFFGLACFAIFSSATGRSQKHAFT